MGGAMANMTGHSKKSAGRARTRRRPTPDRSGQDFDGFPTAHQYCPTQR